MRSSTRIVSPRGGEVLDGYVGTHLRQEVSGHPQHEASTSSGEVPAGPSLRLVQRIRPGYVLLVEDVGQRSSHPRGPGDHVPRGARSSWNVASAPRRAGMITENDTTVERSRGRPGRSGTSSSTHRSISGWSWDELWCFVPTSLEEVREVRGEPEAEHEACIPSARWLWMVCPEQVVADDPPTLDEIPWPGCVEREEACVRGASLPFESTNGRYPSTSRANFESTRVSRWNTSWTPPRCMSPDSSESANVESHRTEVVSRGSSRGPSEVLDGRHGEEPYRRAAVRCRASDVLFRRPSGRRPRNRR